MLLNTLMVEVIRERKKDHPLVKREIFISNFPGNGINSVVESILAVNVIFLD